MASSKPFHVDAPRGRIAAESGGGGGRGEGADRFTPRQRRVSKEPANGCGAGNFTLSRQRLLGASTTSEAVMTQTQRIVQKTRSGPK